MTKIFKFCLCIIILNITTVLTFKIFNGDIDIENYLANNICNNFDLHYHTYKWATILVSNLTFSNIKKLKVKKYFWIKYQHCFSLLIYNKNTFEVVNEIKHNNKIRFKSLQVIFDFTFLKNINIKYLNQIITLFNYIYFNCTNCYQMIAIMPKMLNTNLVDLMQNFLHKTMSDFSMIFATLKSSFTVHIRPIINGCYKTSKVFIFKSYSNYQQLKTSYKYCNLNKKTLNISVNEAIPFCNLLKNNKNVYFGIYYSMESEYIKLLSLKLNFSINLIYANQVWGSEYNPTKEWYKIGMIGQIYNKVIYF